ncbi:MAG: C25 family cysteine peptidase [Chitinophagales bacterium]|nr:hypothetical protein [Bacteroidota bacterium]MCB9043508.1 hypothetical protein [Chitinophagales bacterium]
MKNCFSIFIFLFVVGNSLWAQEAANSWIDYNQTYYKFYVEADGVYRIPYSALVAAGLPLESSGFALYNKGREIPIYISTNGTLGNNDYIEFVGKANDGEFDTQLFQQNSWQLAVERSLFTSKAAYFLAWDNSAAHQRYTTLTNNLNNPPEADAFYYYTNKNFFATAHFAGEPFSNLSGVNNNYADFGKGEGWVGAVASESTPQSYTVSLPNIYNNNGQVAIEMKIVGRSNEAVVLNDHHIQVLWNNQVIVDDIYEGYSIQKYNINLPLGDLNATNTLTLKSLGVDDVEVDRSSMAYFFINYPRNFDFNNQKVFWFELLDNKDHYLEIQNFDGGASPVLYDYQNGVRMVASQNNNSYKILLPEFNTSSSSNKTLVLSNNTPDDVNGVKLISDLEAKNFVDYSNPALSANYIILTANKLREGDTDQIQRYEDYRKSAAGGNYKVLTVDMQELYDQFSWGILQHPLSIRNFVNAVINNHNLGLWADTPEYLFLLGRSIRYNKTTIPEYWNLNYVPTYGESGSDVMLTTANIFTYRNQLAVGRVSATTPDDVKNYLDKVIEYESFLANPQPCDKETVGWSKNIIHIAGGKNATEAGNYTLSLNDYKEIVEDTLWGARVLSTFSKGQGGVIAAPQQFADYMNEGLSLITYIGHSGGSLWEFDIREPDSYENKGKYPFIFSNSCFVGDLHSTADDIMSKRYTLAQERGSIAFLATVGFGFPFYLDIYATQLHINMSQKMYGQSIGKMLQQTIFDIYKNPSESFYDGVKLTCQEFTLSGDPAIRLLQWDKPEYTVEPEDINFFPSVLTTAIDSFDLQVVVNNLGKAVADSFNLSVTRTLPNGEFTTFTNRYPGIKYSDTLVFRLPVLSVEALGNNTFSVNIATDASISEYCTDNNTATSEAYILPSYASPIYPCNYSIINKQDIALTALTAQAILEETNYYRMELDTTPSFNSNILQATELANNGGVLSWQPNVAFIPEIVYYWRVSAVPEAGASYNWISSSFIYIPSQPEGWNQSHYGQFQNDSYENMYLANNATHEFEFDKSLNTLKGSVNANSYATYLNDTQFSSGTCLGGACNGGVVFAVFKNSTPLEIVTSPLDPATASLQGCERKGLLGNVQCGGANLFEFSTIDADAYSKIAAFLDWIPNGYFVLGYSVGNHRLQQGAAPTADLEQVYNRLENMGINLISSVSASSPFMFFTQKNVVNYPVVWQQTTQSSEFIEYDIEVYSNQSSGNVISTLIGPSSKWRSLQWNSSSVDADTSLETANVNVFGVGNNGNETFLFNTNNIKNWDLSFVNAQNYPFLKLKLATEDNHFLTPTQLQYWRVYHDKVPEWVFDHSRHFVFDDTLYVGQAANIEIAVGNISDTASPDSIPYTLRIYNSGNQLITEKNQKLLPLKAHAYTNLANSFETPSQSGEYSLQIELNPNGTRPEKILYNNLLQLPFYVLGDKGNPLLDVTFDGQHILDGDIVSAKPNIDVGIFDENLLLALNDTSIARIYLADPNEVEQRIYFSDSRLSFSPANPSAQDKNEAHIFFTPTLLADGTYRLRVEASDISGNKVSDIDFAIRFVVINKPMISNVLNYPNPFTTSTKFVFTLTGSEVPDKLLIQIMTVSGRVVREISSAELGNLHIGRNITDYAWDGKDAFGNELANGVYFYRVIARDALGQSLELFTHKANALNPFEYNISATDKMDAMFGKYGIGKMYKLR